MATGPQFIEALAPVCGIHPATLDRYMRELRGASLIPAGGRGGGIAAAHLNYEHAAIIILSLAATSPAGAVAAYETVKDLDRENVQAGDFAGLAFTLAMTIRHAASRIYASLTDPRVSSAPLADTEKWELTICLEPVDVWMSWTVDGTERREGFSDRQSALPRPAHPQDVYRGIRRQTIITTAVLNVAAELVADTMQHEAEKAKRQNSLQAAMSLVEHCDSLASEINGLVDAKLAQAKAWLSEANARQAAINAEMAAKNAERSARYCKRGAERDAQFEQRTAALRAKLNPQNAGTLQSPQNETAATLAGEAAAVCAQSDETEVVSSLQPHLKRERKFPQATVLSAGHPPHTRNQHDEPDRYGGLNFAPA